MRRISLAVPLRTIGFSPVQIKKIFAPLSGVQKTEIKENAVEFAFSAKEPLLVFSRGMLPSIERLSRDRTWVVIRSLALSLAFLLFLRSFTLTRWRLLRTLGIFTGMVLVFFVLLILPFAASVLRMPDPWTLDEKRELASRPEIDPGNLAEFPRAFDEFFTDRFRFRSLLIRAHNLTRVLGFGVSPIPQVVIGKRGWLFYGRENATRNVIDYYRSVVPFTPAELENWRKTLEARRDWLATRGIAYLVVMVPNKSTIYPEYLPAGVDHTAPIKAGPAAGTSAVPFHFPRPRSAPGPDCRQNQRPPLSHNRQSLERRRSLRRISKNHGNAGKIPSGSASTPHFILLDPVPNDDRVETWRSCSASPIF